MAYIPERGDIIWMQFNPQAGREQAGRRPALVLSPYNYNRITGLVIVCPVTNRTKGFRFEVALPADLGVAGVILSDHVKNLDWRVRNAEFITKLPDEILDHVLAKLNTLLLIK